MSSIADREAWRTGRPVSRPTGWRIELVFWLVLLAMAAVMIAAAVAGAFYGIQAAPSERFRSARNYCPTRVSGRRPVRERGQELERFRN